MPRKPPPAHLDPSKVPTLIRERSRTPLLSIELAVVTPMFGGGARPRESDPDLPIRPSSIRGHLRFWWRACKARQFPNAEELFAAESRIWGKAAGAARNDQTGPSAVDIAVEILDAGTPVPCATYEPSRSDPRRLNLRWRSGYPGYALFPFQGELDGSRTRVIIAPSLGIEGAKFRLVLHMAAHVPETVRTELLADVQMAVRTWIAFGGVGARSRRGCGSLFCVTDDRRFRPGDDLSDINEWMDSLYQHFSETDAGCLTVPVLRTAPVIGSMAESPLRSWGIAIDAMQRFRQGIGFARDEGRDARGRPKPGRSRWPESDSVRRLANVHDGHLPRSEAAPYFPRANLGLPIVFQFQVPRGQARQQHTLEAHGEGAARMASPIILKPLTVRLDTACPLALLLDVPPVWNAQQLGHPPIRVCLQEKVVSPAQLFDPEKSHLVEPLDGYEDAREAFMAFAHELWNRPAGARR